MRKIAITLALAGALGGCISQAEREAAFAAYQETRADLKRRYDGNKITFTQFVEHRNAAVRERLLPLLGPTSRQKEAILYSEVLAPQVDKRKMTTAEFFYLEEKKMSEMLGSEQDARQKERMVTAMQEAARPRNANCKPQRWGEFVTTNCL